MFVAYPNNPDMVALGDTVLDQLLNFAYELALRREQLLQSRYSHFIKCVRAYNRSQYPRGTWSVKLTRIPSGAGQTLFYRRRCRRSTAFALFFRPIIRKT